jgi:hypothetical protein
MIDTAASPRRLSTKANRAGGLDEVLPASVALTLLVDTAAI